MCEIFLRGDPSLFEKRSRSMRIDGHVTSVCVEVIFWDMLERVSCEQNLKLSQFITELYREGLIKTGEKNNLSSVLRVACLNYLTHEDTFLPNSQRMPQATMAI